MAHTKLSKQAPDRWATSDGYTVRRFTHTEAGRHTLGRYFFAVTAPGGQRLREASALWDARDLITSHREALSKGTDR
jgi:hypothetical protein